MIRRISILGFVVCMLLTTSGVSGQIYKWVDEDGKTHFSSSPPTNVDAETVQPKTTNTYSGSDLSVPSDTSTKKAINRKKVVMYSAVWCGVCKKAKKYFREHRIPFNEYDIETSEKGKRDYKKLNGSGVPIILVDKQRMNGFSAARFKSMYGG